jgi:outer membrane lipoprotein-sorting protein
MARTSQTLSLFNALVLGLLLPILALPVHAAGWRIDQLMSALARGSNGTATFTERKYLAVVDIPVDSSGELRFIPPDRLEKHTLKPVPEAMVLDGNTLTIERRNQKHVLQLQDYPGVAGMIGSIRATLAGDRKGLEQVYRLALSGTAEQWSLRLTPHDPGVARVVMQIRIEGSQDEVRMVEIEQADGDHSTMTIHKAGGS